MCGGLTIHKLSLSLQFCGREHGLGEQRDLEGYFPMPLQLKQCLISLPALPYLFINKLN